MKLEVSPQTAELKGNSIDRTGTVNLSPEQAKTLKRLGAMALVGAGIIAAKDAEAVVLIPLNENGLNGLRGVGSGWNGGAGSGVAVEKFQVDSPTMLTEASAIANLRVGLNNYGKPITDPQWQTFRINIYRDDNGVPENWLTPTFQIAVDSSMIQLTPTSLVDNNNQTFYKVQMSINQLIDQSGTYHMGIAFDGTQHSGSSLPVFSTNMDSLVNFADPSMSLYTNNGVWSGTQYPGTDQYANINTGLIGEPVPEPSTVVAFVALAGALTANRIKKMLGKS